MAPLDGAWITAGSMLVINVVGWSIALIRNNKNEGKDAGQLIGTIKSLTEKVNKLPCVSNTDYVLNMGKLTEKVDGLGKRFDKLEDMVRGNHHKQE